jgi:hypothetical protein
MILNKADVKETTSPESIVSAGASSREKYPCNTRGAGPSDALPCLLSPSYRLKSAD